MQISVQSLFNAIKEDPKNAKALIKSASTPDIKTSTTQHTKSSVTQNTTQNTTQNAVQNATKTLDNVLLSLSKGQISKNQALSEVNSNPAFKSNTTTSSDMKSLLTLVQKEPTLSRFEQPLKDFVKHIASVDGENLKTQVDKSGVGFEAKLASQTKKPILPLEIKNVLKESIIQKSVSFDEAPTKQTDSLQNSAKNLLQKENVFKEDMKFFRNELRENIKNLPQIPPKIEASLKVLDRLEDVLKKLDFPKEVQKGSENVDTKVNTKQDIKLDIKQDVSQNIKQEVKLDTKFDIKPDVKGNPLIDTKNSIKFTDNVKQILQDIKIQTPSLKLDFNVSQEVKVLIKEIENLTKELDKAQIQTTQPQQSQTLQLPQIQPVEQDLNLQDKIKMLTSRMRQSIEIESKMHMDTFAKQKNLNRTLDTVDKNMQNFPTKSQNDDQNVIKNDIKHTLNHLKEAPQKDISNLSSKILTNIESNQLISYVNNTINTYIPYVWDGLKEGSVAFKNGKDDSFFCQVDLNLKVYGRVNMMLMLTNDNYISISISAEKEILSDKVSENLPQLKQALNKTGLVPLSINMKPFNQQNEYGEDGWSRYNMDLKA